MTPERKNYFASISKEEIYIRRRIRQLKDAISDDKYALNNGTCMKRLRKTCIRENKTIIKALKKQLPQEPIYHDWGIRYCYYCPTCHFIINHYEDRWKDGCCCSKCGQKLR